MRTFSFLFALLVLLAGPVLGELVSFEGSWGRPGFNLVSEAPGGVEIVYSIARLRFEDLEFDGELMKVVTIPGVFLPNNEGAPNLPGAGRFIAIPQQASARLTILGSRTEVYKNINLAPAPPIPLETDDSPPTYRKDQAIYERNAYYPAEPVRLSSPMEIRGVDAVILGITPFQYNPVTKELVVYRDLRVRIDFTGGNGYFGEDRLRNKFWEPVLQGHLLNYSSLPKIDFYQPLEPKQEGYEYVIIVPDDPDFQAWGDSVKAWRKLQGIYTEVFALSEIGGNSVSAIQTFVDTAYSNWAMPPVAFLLLSDYQSSGKLYGITSPIWNSYCVSDNMYADVNGDDLPELNFARITAQNPTHLQEMVTKFLDYERNPPTDPGFYDHPLMACGWQTERWFQLCTEIVRGFLINELGKDPARQYNVYSGSPSPGCAWSTNPNTYMLIDYFGSAGLGYVPDTNPYDYSWWDNGSAAGINAAINSGAFLLQHRDHGAETGWGEPNYGIGDLSGLSNDMLTFVFSINCLTGKYNWSSECFAEAFQRMHYGALGLLAASEISYSFVNDTYVFGYWDLLYPEFDPGYSSGDLTGHSNLRPGFANASGKYYLQAHNWPYNPEHKVYTYHLFHMHGDAFTTLYSEVPQNLSVSHAGVLNAGQTIFPVTADDSSIIALTVSGEIIGVAEGTGMPVDITISAQTPGDTMIVTVTKANYYRYQADVPVVAGSGPYVLYLKHIVDDAAGGNGDGIVNPAETIELPLWVRNWGNDAGDGVTGTLATSDSFITAIWDTLKLFGSIASQDSAYTGPDGYNFTVSTATPDQHRLRFSLTCKDVNDSTWLSSFYVPVAAPIISYLSYVVSDPAPGGNGNGMAEPGETVDIEVTLENTGHADAINVQADLSTADPYITINTSHASYGDIGTGSSAVSSPPYNISIDPGCPAPYFPLFDLNITASGGYASTDSFTIVVGTTGFFDDIESGQGDWSHYPGTPQYTDEWHITEFRNHSPTHSWKCGSRVDPGQYADYDDACLETPDVVLAPGSRLTFWHWISAEIESPTVAWDGGIVQISTDSGGSWELIYPVGGYPYVLENNPAHPFPGLPCFSGFSTEWVQEEFDLSAYMGSVRIRFRFGSDGWVTYEGWYVDDIWVGLPTGVEELTAQQPSLSKFELSQSYPNPFSQFTVISYQLPVPRHTTLKIYDLGGRLVRTLMDGEQGPGSYSVLWDGKDSSKRPLANGIYFYRLSAKATVGLPGEEGVLRSGQFECTKKMTLFR